MAEEAQPAKRRSGRPPKVAVAPKVESDTEVVVETLVADVPADPSDPRIGQSCDPGWSSVGYGDGCTYLCRNGKIVEKVFL